MPVVRRSSSIPKAIDDIHEKGARFHPGFYTGHLTLDLFTNYNHTLAYAWGVHALPDLWAVQVIASKKEEALDVHLFLRRNIVIVKPDGLLYKQPH